MNARTDPLGPLQLLIVQATPFCNIDCGYCYLPDRTVKRRMSSDVLERLFHRIAEEPRAYGKSFTVCWHAGEPLTAGIPFYERALALSREAFEGLCSVEHAIQTNGTLVTADWCRFFKSSSLRVGLSIDGPAFLHDAYRKTRRGGGTHAAVLRAVRLLKEHDIQFRVIAVITSDTLNHPESFYDFFKNSGISRVGLNIEEVENVHVRSSMYSATVDARLRSFLRTIFAMSLADGAVRFREFDVVRSAVRGPETRGSSPHQLTTGFAILSCDIDGNLSTFSPELLGAKAPKYGDFLIGNVCNTSLSEMARGTVYETVNREVRQGVRRCESQCDYFDLCGGGAPANKYFENGTMDSSETQFCRLTRQAVVDMGLEVLETKYLAGRPHASATAL